MVFVKIVGVSHPKRFAEELTGKEARVVESIERMRAEFSLHNHECMMIHSYESGETVIWTDTKGIRALLKRLLELEGYLKNAMILGEIPPVECNGESYLKVPGGVIRICRMGDELWIGTAGDSSFFAATVLGIAELLEVLGEKK